MHSHGIVTSSSHGRSLGAKGRVPSAGTPTQPNWIVRYSTVQEPATTNWSASSVAPALRIATFGSPTPASGFRFTHWSVPGGTGDHLFTDPSATTTALTFRDCEFGGGGFWVERFPVALTNCLWERVSVDLDDDGQDVGRDVFHNTFHGGSLSLERYGEGPWRVKDNLFEQTTLTSYGGATVGNNGFTTNTVNPLGGSNNKTNLLTDFQTGPLGRFYLPTSGATNSLTNLFNAGSINATNAGLFHYTTTTNQVKETNSTVDIGYHTVAVSTGNLALDTDSDGVPDYLEDANGNGVKDSNETDFNDSDTDYDGRTDGQEIAEGTNPLDPGSAEPVRLAYWRFDTTDFKGEAGQLPLTASAVQSVNGFQNGGVQVTNSSGILRYRDVETNGLPNINLRTGSIRFLFKPNWSSTTVPGGTGPGALIRLVSLGTYTTSAPINGCFILNLDSSGTVVGFVVQNSEGKATPTNYQAVSFTNGVWHEIAIAFTTNYLMLWVDGVTNGFASGHAYPPPPSTRQQGFVIGNDTAGGGPVRGIIDELETFNYPLGRIDTNSAGRVISALVKENPPSIELRWRCMPNVSRTVFRRTPPTTTWTTLATNYYGYSYTDTNVTVGQIYEYRSSGMDWVDLTIQAGIRLPLVETRGWTLLLVDSTLTNSLAAELAQLKTDLIGDGWRVIRHDVPRHDDSVWSNNTNNLALIKSLVVSNYNVFSNDLKCLFIVGHVVVPYSGMDAEDGHGGPTDNHWGAWPMDIYYGDVDGLYTDILAYDRPYPLMFIENTNSVGDGKFDQNFIPTNAAGVAALEVPIGRIDFARMPTFTNLFATNTEVSLLRQYFQKDHNYRHGLISFGGRAVASGHFLNNIDTTVFANALVNGSKWFGHESGDFLDGNPFKQTTPVLWGFEAGHGGRTSIEYGQADEHTTEDLADPTQESAVGFYMLLGSIFGDWNLTDNFLRATLGTPNYGLGAMWVRFHRWRLEGMSLGGTLADGLLATANDPIECPVGPRRVLAIMGDPALHLQIVRPPTGVTASTNGGVVELQWSPGSANAGGFHVYRAASLDGEFTRLTSSPVLGNVFVDVTPPSGTKVYQVRALELTRTGTGSFTNQSTGILLTVP